MFRGRIQAEPLSIWSGCGGRGSERFLIQCICREGISGFPLIRTGVGIPFRRWMSLGFGTGSRLLLSFLRFVAVDFWFGVFYSWVITVSCLLSMPVVPLGASCNLFLILFVSEVFVGLYRILTVRFWYYCTSQVL